MKVDVFFAIYDGMKPGTPTDKLVTFVERKRTLKPLYSGGGNLGFVKLIRKKDHDLIVSSLKRFVKHDLLCGIVGGYGRCTCGLEQLLNVDEAVKNVRPE